MFTEWLRDLLADLEGPGFNSYSVDLLCTGLCVDADRLAQGDDVSGEDLGELRRWAVGAWEKHMQRLHK